MGEIVRRYSPQEHHTLMEISRLSVSRTKAAPHRPVRRANRWAWVQRGVLLIIIVLVVGILWVLR